MTREKYYVKHNNIGFVISRVGCNNYHCLKQSHDNKYLTHDHYLMSYNNFYKHLKVQLL